VTLRKYGWLFFTTLLLGGLGGIVVTLVFEADKMTAGDTANFFMGMWMSLLYGMTISIASQMGFFAYMMFQYFARTLFTSPSLWKKIQILLVLFAFFDMVYLRYSTFGGSLWLYFVEPVMLLIVSLATAWAKTSVTNRSAWVPTLFFMFVVTALEWIPALKQNNVYATLSMLVPLLFCNVWQVMQLHRVLKPQS